MTAPLLSRSLLAVTETLATPTVGEEPEAWAAPIEEGFAYTGAVARKDLDSDVQRYVRAGYDGERFSYRRNELLLLVQQHYFCRVQDNAEAIFWAVPRGVLARWHDRGIVGPQTPARPLQEHLREIMAASRVSDLLDANTSYTKMRQLAREAGPVDPPALAWSLAARTLTEAVESLALRHGGVLAQAGADMERANILGVLAHTPAPRRRMVFERMARNLTTLTGGQDWGREWERAAVTVTRYAVNLGTLSHLRDRHARYVAYTVHPQACTHCKKLLLWPNGAVRCFAPELLLSQLAEDGGLNIGRRAGRPVEQGGWRVALVIHPWCRCRLRRATRPEVAEDKTQRAKQSQKEDRDTLNPRNIKEIRQ